MGDAARDGVAERAHVSKPGAAMAAAGGFALAPRVKSQGLRGLRPRDTETQVVVPVDRGVPVAIGRTEVPGIVAPGTAAADTGVAIATGPCGAVLRRPFVVIAVFHPLPHIASHVVKAKCV
jgi:hypothetical protein